MFRLWATRETHLGGDVDVPFSTHDQRYHEGGLGHRMKGIGGNLGRAIQPESRYDTFMATKGYGRYLISGQRQAREVCWLFFNIRHMMDPPQYRESRI